MSRLSRRHDKSCKTVLSSTQQHGQQCAVAPRSGRCPQVPHLLQVAWRARRLACRPICRNAPWVLHWARCLACCSSGLSCLLRLRRLRWALRRLRRTCRLAFFARPLPARSPRRRHACRGVALSRCRPLRHVPTPRAACRSACSTPSRALRASAPSVPRARLLLPPSVRRRSRCNISAAERAVERLRAPAPPTASSFERALRISDEHLLCYEPPTVPP